VRYEYEAQSRLWVNDLGGCYYERPRTNSEVDIMEWFASLDEDDWEALLDMNEDMDAEGCGPVRHYTNGAEGPRERQDELEYNSPPHLINGAGGGSSDPIYCPGNHAWFLFTDCMNHWMDSGYSTQDAYDDCLWVCAISDPYPNAQMNPDYQQCLEDYIGDNLETTQKVTLVLCAVFGLLTGGFGFVQCLAGSYSSFMLIGIENCREEHSVLA